MSDKNKARINAPILLDFTDGEFFLYEIPDGIIGEMDGKIRLIGFAKDLKHKGEDFWGRPIPDEDELKKPRELIFWKEQVQRHAEGTTGLSRNRQIFTIMPTQYDMNNPEYFQNTKLFKIMKPYIDKIDYLSTAVKNLNESMIQLKRLTLMYGSGEMTDAQFNQVREQMDSILKYSQSIQSKLNTPQDGQKPF